MTDKRYHVVSFAFEGTDAKHQTFATQEEADKAVVEAPADRPTFRIDSSEDLKAKLSMAQMVALHNALRSKKPIRSFHDAGKGASRVMGLMEAPPQKETADMKTKTANGKSNLRRKASGQGRPSKYDPSSKLRILKKFEETGKREGTWSAKQYAMYREGMTVGTLLEKGAKPAYIAWDIDHGIIKVEKASAA